MAAEKVYQIELDYGHGGTDPGAVFGKFVEKAMTLTTGEAARKELERHGVKVYTTRTTDVYVGINERAAKANKDKVDLFLSVHYNAGGGDGVEAIHGIYAGKSKDFAQSVVNSIKTEMNQNARPRDVFYREGAPGQDYHGVIRQTNMPAIIVEGAFIDSKDVDVVDTTAKQQKMGVAIAHGVLNYLKIAIKDAPKPAKEVDTPGAKTPVVKKIYGVTTADLLNVRKGAGVKYPVVGQFKKGRKVTIYKELNGWYKVLLSKPDYGWVSGHYVKDGAIANCTILNVRKGPSVKTDAFDTIKVGKKVKIVETKNGWHRIILNPSEYGWVNKGYVK